MGLEWSFVGSPPSSCGFPPMEPPPRRHRRRKDAATVERRGIEWARVSCPVNALDFNTASDPSQRATRAGDLAPHRRKHESASRPLVCFGGLIDNTIKGLTILLSIWAEIDYHICYICDEIYQCSRQNSYDKMNATTWSSMRMITSNEYCVNWDMCYWWRIHSHI